MILIFVTNNNKIILMYELDIFTTCRYRYKTNERFHKSNFFIIVTSILQQDIHVRTVPSPPPPTFPLYILLYATEVFFFFRNDTGWEHVSMFDSFLARQQQTEAEPLKFPNTFSYTRPCVGDPTLISYTHDDILERANGKNNNNKNTNNSRNTSRRLVLQCVR